MKISSKFFVSLLKFGVVTVVGLVSYQLFVRDSVSKPAAAQAVAPVAAQAVASFSPYVDAKGNISLPQDYRTTFLHLGTFSVASKTEKEAAELHNVYTRKEDWATYKSTGKWPDGAIIVKDVYETSSEDLTTGHSSWASKIKVWFVMVKDTTKRFPDNEIWGDGWGWALFEGKDRNKQVSESYKSDCRSCHVPARKTDWLYLDRLPSP